MIQFGFNFCTSWVEEKKNLLEKKIISLYRVAASPMLTSVSISCRFLIRRSSRFFHFHCPSVSRKHIELQKVSLNLPTNFSTTTFMTKVFRWKDLKSYNLNPSKNIEVKSKISNLHLFSTFLTVLYLLEQNQIDIKIRIKNNKQCRGFLSAGGNDLITIIYHNL